MPIFFIKQNKYIFIFLIFTLKTVKNSLCNDNSELYGLYLNTSADQNFHVTNFPIIYQCQINKYWKVKTDLETKTHIHKVLEDENFNRRVLRFGYNYTKTKFPKSSPIFNIKIIPHIKEGTGLITFGNQKVENILQHNYYNFNFDTKNDIAHITYMTYHCLDNKDIYFKAKVDILIQDEYTNEIIFPIEIFKICKHSVDINDDSIDICHAIIIIISVAIIFFSNMPFFESKLERTILKRFPEIWGPENLSVINFSLVILLYVFYIGGISDFFLYITTVIVSIISLVMIFEALLKITPLKKNMGYRTLEIEFVGSISMYLIFCGILSIIIFIIYKWSYNVIMHDIISISICLISIRIFKFTSFKYILSVSFLIWCYEILYIMFKSSELLLHYYNGIIVNQFDISFPILIICPQFNSYSSLYTEYICLSIGEVIMPGIYINYLYRFDKKVHLHSNYYYTIGLIVFTFGLLLKMLLYCYASLKLPAFSFTFPVMTLIVYYLANNRKQWEEMIGGFKRNPFIESEIDSQRLQSFALSYYRDSQQSSEYIGSKNT